MEEMYIESLTTVYNLRNRAVAEFALLYYGASAMPSMSIILYAIFSYPFS